MKVEEKVERRGRERGDEMRVGRYYFSVWLLRKYRRRINVLIFQSFLFPLYFLYKTPVLLRIHFVYDVFTPKVMISFLLFLEILKVLNIVDFFKFNPWYLTFIPFWLLEIFKSIWFLSFVEILKLLNIVDFSNSVFDI